MITTENTEPILPGELNSRSAAFLSLYEEDAERRAAAVRFLASEDETVITSLIAMLDGRDPFIQYGYIAASSPHSLHIPQAQESAAEALILIGEATIPYIMLWLPRFKPDTLLLIQRILKTIEAPATEALIPLLESRDVQTQSAAVMVLAGFRNEKAREALRNLLLKEIRCRSKNRLRSTGNIFLFCAMNTVFASLSTRWLGLPGTINMGAVSLASVFFFQQWYRNEAVRDNLRRTAVTGLRLGQDIRMVGLLALYFRDKDDKVRVMATDSLSRLLPTVKASDREKLTAEDQKALVQLLEALSKAWPVNQHLLLSLLKALEQVGDAVALPGVEELARHHRAAEVRRASEACLPFLRQRANEARQSQTLLRASHSVVNEPPEVLLRPAQEAGTEPEVQQQLLRPSG